MSDSVSAKAECGTLDLTPGSVIEDSPGSPSGDSVNGMKSDGIHGTIHVTPGLNLLMLALKHIQVRRPWWPEQKSCANLQPRRSVTILYVIRYLNAT